MAMAMPAPRNSLPPNRLVAVKPTRIGRKANGAEASRLIKPARPSICGYCSTKDNSPNRFLAVSTLFRAMSKPPPTRIGISGTKISASTLIERVKTLPLLATTSLSSSVLTAMLLLVALSSSLNTVLTSPGPTIIWNIPPVSKVPFRSGSLSKAFWSTFFESFSTIRRRVAQWAAATILSSPPTALRTRSATSLCCIRTSPYV